MEDTLERLRDLTDKLPAVPKLGDLVFALGGNARTPIEHKLKLPGGFYKSYCLFSSPEISVARSFVSSGAEFPEHLHDEKEYGLIYAGKVMVRSQGEERILLPGDCIIYEAGVSHYGKALEDTWFIAITIPFSKDYPRHE